MGRVIGLPPLQNSSAPVDLQYSIPGFDGTNRQVTFRYRTLANARTDSSQALRYKGDRDCPGFPENVVSPSLFTSIAATDSVCWGGILFDPVVLYQIVIPNGGTYTFTYNVYGEIDKVVMPTGGYERFRYETVDPISFASRWNVFGKANRGVVEHWISAKGDGTDEVKWDYALLSSGTMTRVTGPNGAKSERLLLVGDTSLFSNPRFGYEDPRAGRAYEERTYNSSGQMLRRTLVDWAVTATTLPSPYNFTSAGRDPRAVKKVEILLDTGGDALVAMTETSYDADFNEIETKYEFGDTPGSLYARTRTKQNSTTWLDDYTYFDGLGRAWRSGHFEATNSWSVKDTEYDTLGRVKRVSNPYLATNLTGAINPSGVWTTTTYDDLNRVLTVTTPDGAQVTTTYSGTQVTVKDAADKRRRSETDGLGRLKSVVEDPLGTPLQTDYSYDTLGNLTIVNQGGQYRYFFYDSLSRLVRARNPEQDANSAHNLTNPPSYNNSWSLAYTYDVNGNLTERKEARNNGSSVPIATSYGYDALYRNLWVSYNDGVTPGVERHYDALTNGKGRLYYQFNYTNNPATGTAGYSRLVIGGYDALGRVTSQTQGFLANDGVTWKDFQSTRTYNLASQVLTQGYPQSGRSVNYSYAASGRLSSADGNLGGTSSAISSATAEAMAMR